MRQKIIKEMEILPTVFSTTPSKGEIIVQENPMYTVSRRFQPILLINVWHKEFPLHVIMAVYWTTVLLEVYWFQEPFMPKGKQDSNCYWVPILP